jgi:hypothetical protein
MINENNEFIVEEETNYSTRNQFGLVSYFKTIEEALVDFLEYEGYRLSIVFGDKSVHFYRDELPELGKAKPGSMAYENPTRTIEYTAKVMVQK